MNMRRSDLVWPAAVIGLILLGMGTTFGMLFASRVDGGPQVIEAYYEKAVAWDSTAAVRASSLALGWTASVALQHTIGGASTIVVTLEDASGEPVSGASGTASLSRPQRAGILETAQLKPGPDAGSYVFAPSATGTGLFDVAIDMTRDDDRFVRTIRSEWHMP